MPRWAEKAAANGMDSAAARAGRLAVPRLLVGFVLVGVFVLLFMTRGTSVWVTRGLLLAAVIAMVCEFVLWREVLFGDVPPAPTSSTTAVALESAPRRPENLASAGEDPEA